jgi:hypothetical protein
MRQPPDDRLRCRLGQCRRLLRPSRESPAHLRFFHVDSPRAGGSSAPRSKIGFHPSNRDDCASTRSVIPGTFYPPDLSPARRCRASFCAKRLRFGAVGGIADTANPALHMRRWIWRCPRSAASSDRGMLRPRGRSGYRSRSRTSAIPPARVATPARFHCQHASPLRINPASLAEPVLQMRIAAEGNAELRFSTNRRRHGPSCPSPRHLGFAQKES